MQPGHFHDPRILITFQGMRRNLTLCAALLSICLGSCNTVEFYEKGALSSPVMSFELDAGRAAFHQKVHYATEGAAGGLGTSAGGGCGCY